MNSNYFPEPGNLIFKSILEMKYVSADNHARYRAIMHFCYLAYKRLNYWVRPEEIYATLKEWNVSPGYTQEQCQSDLNQLVEWKNLAARHDGGRASSLEEYMRKKMQYLMTPYSIEIERLLESLEKVTGYGGSLEASLFDTIEQKLIQIRLNTAEMGPEEALELWQSLHQSFVKLHENAADYMASLQTARAEEMMVAESFFIFKDKMIDYLKNFVQALQRNAYRIEDSMGQIGNGVRDLFLEQALEGELARPTLEEQPDRKELLREMRQGWDNIRRWFIGNIGADSELTLLERATKDAIARIVRSAIRIQERNRVGLNRKKELEYLARWFDREQSLEEAHQLAAYAFGLFATRHLQGEDLRSSDSAEMSMWEENPTKRQIRSRSRKRGERTDAEPVKNNEERKRREKEQYRAAQQEETLLMAKMLERKSIRISQIGIVSPQIRSWMLSWIGRCLNAGTKRGFTFTTPEGILIRLVRASNGERALLHAEDGDLEMEDYELRFEVRSDGNSVTQAVQEEDRI